MHTLQSSWSSMYDYFNSGVTHLTNTTYRLDLIIVTWDPASSPYCGEVLYYQVVISSDEHVNIPNDIVNATCLAVTFLDLRSNTTYTITVAAVNKAGIGMGDSITVKTAATEVIAGPGSNIQIQVTGMWIKGLCVFYVDHIHGMYVMALYRTMV